jgi:hypothetical protein
MEMKFINVKSSLGAGFQVNGIQLSQKAPKSAGIRLERPSSEVASRLPAWQHKYPTRSSGIDEQT